MRREKSGLGDKLSRLYLKSLVVWQNSTEIRTQHRAQRKIISKLSSSLLKFQKVSEGISVIKPFKTLHSKNIL